MSGMDRTTGRRLGGREHLRQSIADILTTPRGTRIGQDMREYGSDVWRWMDSPMADDVVVEIYAATAEALRRWEPRLRVTRIRARPSPDGQVQIDIEGRHRPDGKDVAIAGLIV